MYDELITVLRTCVDKDKGCSECPYCKRCMNNTSGKHVAMVEAADAIEELLKIAKAMHTWIFLNSADEQKAYEECGLTDEINFALGYGGKVVVKPEEDEAKKPYDLLYEEGGLGIR